MLGRRIGGCLRFLGVPYAAPPTGERRFTAPVRPESWTGVRPAERFGPSALQLGSGRRSGRFAWALARKQQSEDCLYLNLWVPERSDRPLPVMVFVHGGAFVLGSGSTFLYSGRELAERHGLIVVTLNYRLGALGFLDTTSMARDGRGFANLGLLDQLAAVAWVRREIAAFGGDPDRITVAGQSAGAMSIGTLLATGRLDCRRAILQSGAVAHVSSVARAAQQSERFLAACDLDRFDLPQLQQLPLQQLLAVSDRFAVEKPGPENRLTWQPSIDGRLLPEAPLDRLRRPEAGRPEVFLGTNRDEWKLFSWSRRRLGRLDRATLLRLVERGLAAEGRSVQNAPALLEQYAGRSHPAEVDGSTRESVTPRELWNRFRTDQVFRVPALELAQALERSGEPPLVYGFDAPLPVAPRRLGSCHAAELPLLFGSWAHPYCRTLYPVSGRRVESVAQALQTVWAEFVRHGSDGLGSSGAAAYESQERRALWFDRGDWRVVSDYAQQAAQLWQVGRVAAEAATADPTATTPPLQW